MYNPDQIGFAMKCARGDRGDLRVPETCQKCKDNDTKLGAVACDFNVSTAFQCYGCIHKGTKTRIELLAEWDRQNISAGRVHADDIDLHAPRARAVVRVPPPIGESASVTSQIEAGITWTDLIGYPTVAAKLETELEGRSVGMFFKSRKVPASVAISLGLSYDMLIATHEDLLDVGNVRYYTARDLNRVGATITRLLMAGLPVNVLVDSCFSREDLVSLSLTRHAFHCAGGTDEDWRTLLENSNVSPSESQALFGGLRR